MRKIYISALQIISKNSIWNRGGNFDRYSTKEVVDWIVNHLENTAYSAGYNDGKADAEIKY